MFVAMFEHSVSVNESMTGSPILELFEKQIFTIVSHGNFLSVFRKESELWILWAGTRWGFEKRIYFLHLALDSMNIMNIVDIVNIVDIMNNIDNITNIAILVNII